ncbi:homeodomain-like protein [Tanacetum coccineum]
MRGYELTLSKRSKSIKSTSANSKIHVAMLYTSALVKFLLAVLLKGLKRWFYRYCEEIHLINVCFADDLFIFARGDVESARVIMDALEEFKMTSGLVPSLPKSTTYFCNVVNHIKNSILNIMPFSEGELPVKYLGVPLISSRLLIRDYKVRVEKAKNRIVPVLDGLKSDVRQWRDRNGNLSSFSVAKAWEAIRPRGNQVDWFRIVWFLHNIPCHAFHLWLVMRNGLKTHDRMRQWDVGPSTDVNLLHFKLCNMQPESHTHLFFECMFAAKVWRYVRGLADMDMLPPVIHDIVLYLQPMGNKRTARCIIGKLTVAATALGASNGIGGTQKLDNKLEAPPLPNGSRVRLSPKNELEGSSIESFAWIQMTSNSILISSKRGKHNLISVLLVSYANTRRLLDYSPSSLPSTPRLSGTPETWENLTATGGTKIPSTGGVNNRKRAMPSGPSPPVAQWICLQLPLVQLCRVCNLDGTTNGPSISKPLKPKLEPVQSPHRMSESEESVGGESRLVTPPKTPNPPLPCGPTIL